MKRAEDEAGVRMTWSAGQPRSSPRLPPPAAAAVVIVGVNREDVSGQSTDQTMWPYVMLLCVLDSVVTRWRPVAYWLSIGAFLAASSDCPCDNYRRASSV